MIGRFPASMLVKGGNAPLFDSPSVHGLAFVDVSFRASDGMTVRGWLIPGYA